MGQLTYDVATSLDGFIAGPNDDVSPFPFEGDHVDAYFERMAGYDTVVMGRKTYEFGYQHGLQPGACAYPGMAHYVFSKSIELPDDSEVTTVRDDWLATIDSLKSRNGSQIYLCGGGELAGWLLEHQRIDRLVLKVAPALVGSGTRLFGANTIAHRASVERVVQHDSGVVTMTYSLN